WRCGVAWAWAAGGRGGGGGGTRFTLDGTGSAWRGPPGAFGVAERGGGGVCGRAGVGGAAALGCAGRGCVPEGVVVAGRTGFGIEPDGRLRGSVTLAVSIGPEKTAPRPPAPLPSRPCSGVIPPAV